jgi:Rrf2 family nitric oxide-sensitive transcriptional repressor|tara:strand:- start:33657 stop:34034 length:378 start_codon:yes stop_codon:yes gene_type:complete
MYLAARPDTLCNVKGLAEHYGISRNHLVKVVHRLAQLGYIETIRGKGGGIKIATATVDLRLGDLVSALEPHMNMVECFDAETNTCRITQSCQLKHYLFEATQSYVDVLNKYTLGDTLTRDNLPFM